MFSDKESFNKVVVEFKKQDKKLKDSLRDKRSKQDFFEHPTIRNYLSRKADSIIFSENHPQLIDSTTKENKKKTDHYELKIYKLFPDLFPYRNADVNSPTFYNQTTFYNHFPFLRALYYNALTSNDISVELGCQNKLEMCPIFFDSDFLHHKIQKTPSTFSRFLLKSISLSGHMFTMISIRNPETSEVLCTLILDSELSTFSNQVKARLHSKRWYTSFDEFDGLSNAPDTFFAITNYLDKHFSLGFDKSLELEKRSFYVINEKEQIALFLNWEKNKGSKEVYDRIATDPRVKILFDLNFEADNTWSLELTFTKMPPIINVSHNLQLTKGDNNCTLFSLNFIQAIAKMLSNKELADKIYALANHSDNVENIPTKEILVEIFREELKSYLPCYYGPTKIAKSQEELKNYHLRQRWNIGSSSLSFFYPLKSNESLNLEENRTILDCKV